MTNNQSIDVNALAMAITNAVLVALQGDVPAPKTSAKVATRAPIARKATKVKTAKSEERITDLSQMPLDALINRACAEAACAQAINAKRIALVPNDLRVLITRPTNAAIKMFCRDKANGVSITDASAMIVAKYEAANGKGSAKRLLAQFA